MREDFNKTELWNISSNSRMKKDKHPRIYSTFGETVDGRKITVVGLIKDFVVDGFLLYTSLNIGYSICSPEDVFNEDIGISIAKKRAETEPISIVSSRGKYDLSNDTIMDILDSKVKYVSENIEKIIK